MRKQLAAAILVGLFTLAGTKVVAQEAHFGPQLDFGTNNLNLGIGGRVDLGLAKSVGAPIDVVGSFDYFFGTSPVTFWEINVNGWYNFKIPQSSVAPYVGGGIAIDHASVDCGGFSGCSATNAGLNLGGGAKFKLKSSKITPFAEARLEIRSGSAFVLTGGILF